MSNPPGIFSHFWRHPYRGLQFTAWRNIEPWYNKHGPGEHVLTAGAGAGTHSEVAGGFPRPESGRA